MDTTRGDPRTLESVVHAEPTWYVTVVHSRAPADIGRHVALSRDRRSLELGRGGDVLGPEALADERISRRHARLELRVGEERPTIRDLGSHNGTSVGGARITDETRLADGDVITLGRTLLLVHRAPAPFQSRRDDGLDGVGYAHAQLVDAVEKIAARMTTVLLRGEPGSGKSHLAGELHRRSEREGPLVTIDCGVLPGQLAYEQLLGKDGQSGCLARARGGTLVLDAIGDADPAIQRCALALIDRCEAAGSVRVIATSRADADDGELLDELAARLTRWIIHVPPLRARREDIPQLARAFITRFAGRAIEPHPRLARALISHDWPGNIRELEAVIECAIIDAGEREPLPLSEGARRLLGRGRSVDSTLEATAPADIFVIAQSGAWFHVPGAERVEIHHRPTLVRLLRALIVRASERPGESMTPGQLLEAGWPGERVREDAGANRVYVALTTLRKLGLRTVLVRDRVGYLIDPALPIRYVEG